MTLLLECVRNKITKKGAYVIRKNKSRAKAFHWAMAKVITSSFPPDVFPYTVVAQGGITSLE